MMTYETMFVNRSEAPPEKIKETTEKIQSIISQNDGEILVSENWGKMKLTYDIKGCQDGNFSRIVFSAKPALIKEMNKLLQIDEDIIRFIIVKASKASVKPVKVEEAADDKGEGSKQEEKATEKEEEKVEEEKATEKEEEKKEETN